MIRDQLISLIGQYQTTQYSWLDIPWCFACLILLVVMYCLLRGLFFLGKRM